MSAIILPLVNRLLARLVGHVSSFLALAVTAAFPILAFNPLRSRLQRLVDRKMKPEDVTFDETSDLLNIQLQALFPTGRLLETLLTCVTGQLNLASAAAYTPVGERLALARETPTGCGAPTDLPIDGSDRDKLLRGQVVAPQDGSGFSFFVPLTSSGGPARHFYGVLALGPRRSGKGYTTPLERGLRILGFEAGKALYVAGLRESAGADIEARLERIERRIASLTS
jgi:hypothetical protein